MNSEKYFKANRPKSAGNTLSPGALSRVSLSHLLAWVVLFFTISTPAEARAEPSELAGTLDAILARAGKSVEDFWTQFGSVTCLEKVTQEKLGKHGKVEYTQKSTFDYLVLLNADAGGLSVEESRMQQGKIRKAKNFALLITNGIPTLLLVFHPYYQAGFHYSFDGEDPVDGQRLVKIRFNHVPGAQSTTALRLRGKDYPLEIQGTAWIDPGSGAIHKISAALEAPMSDHNLKSLKMEVSYDPHKFSPGDSASWLPSTAAVEISTERQQWRNVHQFSNYKKFTIDTQEVVSRMPHVP